MDQVQEIRQFSRQRSASKAEVTHIKDESCWGISFWVSVLPRFTLAQYSLYSYPLDWCHLTPSASPIARLRRDHKSELLEHQFCQSATRGLTWFLWDRTLKTKTESVDIHDQASWIPDLLQGARPRTNRSGVSLDHPRWNVVWPRHVETQQEVLSIF
jgi:hypothetical protein